MQQKNELTVQETPHIRPEDEKQALFQAGVFREEAMQNYIQQQRAPMSPEFMKTRFFLPLWLALGALWLIIFLLGILLVLSTGISLLDMSLLHVLG